MMGRGFGMFGGGGIVGIILIAIVAYFLFKYFNENQSNTNTFSKKTMQLIYQIKDTQKVK